MRIFQKGFNYSQDGPGNRLVYHLQGCNLRCGCCHNPDTWELSGGTKYTSQQIVEKVLRCKEYFGKDAKIKVIANLPYYITTPIMFRLLEIDNIVEEIFMVQKEMGDRFTGEVNTKDYNALSVFVKYHTETKKAFIVGKNNFFPAPNVDSVILHSFIQKKDYGLNNEANFLKFVRNAFIQRRKTFVNNISKVLFV